MNEDAWDFPRRPTKPSYHRSCRMCSREFDADHASKRHCSDRCAYIATRWSQYKFKYGNDSMTKEQAIENYGAMFDNPLRLILHTRYAPAIRVIYDHCIAHNTQEFTCEQVTSDKLRITPQQLGHIANDRYHPISNTGRMALNKLGTGSGIVWKLQIGMD